jgi:hypothetical protein
MTTYPNLGIDVLSGKLRPNARLWKLLLVISILAFLILPITINKLLGDGILFKVLCGIIIAFFLICVTVFKYMDKYEIIGKLILDTKGIIIKFAIDKKLLTITDVMEIHLNITDIWNSLISVVDLC